MEIELARSSDATALVALRDDIARWLASRGVDQWNPGEFSVDRMVSWIRGGRVHVARQPGRIAAAVSVLWEDPHVWGPDPSPTAGYIHLLMVDRHLAGRGWGDVMLVHAENQIARRGRPLARLDAVATNPVLLDWYRQRGYRDVGARTFEDRDWHDAILMEKPLDGPAPREPEPTSHR